MIKYTRLRIENDWISWERKKAAPPDILLIAFEDIEKWKNDNKIIIVYLKEEKNIKIFKTLAIKYDNIPFVNIEDAKLAQIYKVVPKSVVVFKNVM